MESHVAPGDTRRDAPSPSRSSSSAPYPPRDSRRTSLASQASSKPLDQTVVAKTLQKIHTAASRTDTLTTFDFGSPPRPPSGADAKAFGADLVPGGFSGLYSRIKASVSRDPVPNESDDASVISPTHQSVPSKTPDGLSIVSPGTASGSSSRLQSPSAAQFPAPDMPKSHIHSPSSSSIVPGIIASALRSADLDHVPRSLEQQGFQPPFSASRTRTPDGSRVVRHNESPSNRARQDRDMDGPDAIESYGVHLLSDNDRTPRPLSRLVPSADRQPNQLPSRERDISRSGKGSNAADRLAMLDSHPPIIQLNQSYLPGFRVSRETSIDGDYSSVTSGTNATGKLKADRPDEARQNAALTSTVTLASASRLRSKVLAKELWMRDETAKECFYCGEPFSTFRRKHHCRICGNIFDSKCTTLVPGKMFGQSNRLRICRPCEGMVYGTEDDSSEYSEDMERSASHRTSVSPNSRSASKGRGSLGISVPLADDHMTLEAPSLGVPVARKPGESKRGSTLIEFANEQTLARPSSSRSLKSLSGLHRMVGHKRHHSRQTHQYMKSIKSHQDDRAPFQRDSDGAGKALLPALRHESIIDPELAPFMSDDGSSDDDAMSIFATLNAEAQSPGKESDKSGLASLMGSARRKGWLSDRGTSVASRDVDSASFISKQITRQRRRNMSISSLYHPKNSPKRTKSNTLLRGFGVSGFANQAPSPKPAPEAANGNSKMIRSSAMRGASAPAVELNQASLRHVRSLLKQMLTDGDIPDSKRWEKALLPILLQCTDDVNPDVHRNDDIDIRHYIKLKKIPGARPGDTAYVSGVVFTKNLTLKSMPRSISNPRVLIVSFAIEYTRHHNHFMSLEPVIAAEKEYLSNLVKRIAVLEPAVLLVEKHVSGLALNFLEERGIAVITNVKASVLNAVSRCTQTKVITSADQLALDPSELGRCANFDVKTYVHGTMKKTFVYFTGCQKDLGCTIVLRGAEMENLSKLKRIAEFMSFVVYNLKLETCVMRDEYVLIPANITGGTLASGKDPTSPETPSVPSSATASQSLTTSGSTASQNQAQSLEGTSPTAPSRQSTIAVSTGSSSVTKVSSEGYQYDQTLSASPSFYDVVEEHKTKIISSSPFVKFMQPYLLTRAREQEAKLGELKRLRDQYFIQQTEENDGLKPEQFELVKPEMVHQLVDKPSKQVREFLFAVHDAEYEAAMHSFQTQKRQWEAYLANNPTMFDPLNHQRIAVLYSMVNSKTNPCVGPEIVALGFYNEHDLDEDFLPDITLGQYVEDLCQSGDTLCAASDCDDTMFNHHRQYVHGNGQMSVTVQQYPSRIRGMQKTILMWSVCRLCGRETQIMPMSENTWKYSFGKYLELTFWSTELIPRAHACPHDIHRNHVRYFGFNNVAVRIQYDAIQLYEILVPRTYITWKVDQDLRLKNEQFLRFKGKLDRFMGSVKSRIESIHVESMPTEKIDDCRAEVDRLLALVKSDHERLTKNLQDKYTNSRWYEIIPLNRAAKAIHENSIQWDKMFSEFEKNFYPSEKDIGLMTALQIKKLVESATSIASDDTAEESHETDEKAKAKSTDVVVTPEMSRRLSILSPEATEDVMASVMRVQLSENDDGIEKPSTSAKNHDQASITGENTGQESSKFSVPSESVSPVDAKKEQSPSVSALSSSTNSIEKDLAPSHEATHATEKMPSEAALDADSSSASNPLEAISQESKIPRPKDSSRRSGAPMPPGTQRTHPDSAPLPLSKTEKLKNLIAEPARALERRMAERMASRAGKQNPSMIPRSVPSKRHVFNLARHYEQLTREWENQRMRERQLRESRGAYPLASSKPVVEVYRDAQEAVKETEPVDDADNSTRRTSAERSTADGSGVAEVAASGAGDKSTSKPDQKLDVDNKSLASQGSAPGEASSLEQGSVEGIEECAVGSAHGTELTNVSLNDSQLDLTELQKQEKSSLFRMLTNFWGERSSSGWSQLDYPFASNEHVWGDADIVVREDEPSSIIALALSSADYLAKLRSFRKEPESPTVKDIDASIESNLLHSKNTNIRYAFQNRGVKAQCKIFYAESFDALRRKCGASERFVESLSRCLEWDSKGGKTKSLFLKTLDDRFVLKSLSPVEVNSFFKFAPDYFAFVHAMLFNGLPSVMAKMFGLFQVTIRNAVSGTEFNWFMLVMENLFYDQTTNRRFDLKGSMRNRKIESTGERDEVLLDENLVDIIFEKPIFAREHTLKLLKASVWNDTLFLSKQNVMDYSLMAGFEDEAREIVVGVIDCIRTYTWDKKLETWIKDRGKNKPTVTSPRDYRNRFRVAMSKYMLLAPNCWHQFQAQQIQGKPVRLLGRKEDSEGRPVEGKDVAGLALQ